MSDIEAEPVQNLSQKLSGLNTDANNNPSQKLDEEQPPPKKSKIDVEENTPPDFEEEESTFKEESAVLVCFSKQYDSHTHNGFPGRVQHNKLRHKTQKFLKILYNAHFSVLAI